MGQKQENPLPEENNDTKLAVQFGRILPKNNYQDQETIPQYTTIQNSTRHSSKARQILNIK